MSYNMPGRQDVHIDAPSTQFSIAFRQDAEGFVADRVFPSVPVQKQSDKYFVFPRGAWFRDEMTKRAPGAEADEATYDLSNDSYLCDEWALGTALADQTRANYDSPLNPELERIQFLTQKGLIRKERAFVDAFFKTGVWTLDQTGVDSSSPGANQFERFDRAGSSPIETVRKQKRIVQLRTGMRPNKLVMGREVYDALVDHPDIVGRIDRGQTNGTAVVLRQNIAALLELEEILVMDGIHNAALEGATDSYAFIGGKAMLLAYVPSAPALQTPAAGLTMEWTGLIPGGARVAQRIRRLRDDKRKSDWFEIEMAFDQKLVSADCAIFSTTAVN